MKPGTDSTAAVRGWGPRPDPEPKAGRARLTLPATRGSSGRWQIPNMGSHRAHVNSFTKRIMDQLALAYGQRPNAEVTRLRARHSARDTELRAELRYRGCRRRTALVGVSLAHMLAMEPESFDRGYVATIPELETETGYGVLAVRRMPRPEGVSHAHLEALARRANAGTVNAEAWPGQRVLTDPRHAGHVISVWLTPSTAAGRAYTENDATLRIAQLLVWSDSQTDLGQTWQQTGVTLH